MKRNIITIFGVLNSKISSILKSTSDISTDVGTLQTDVGNMQTTVGGLQTTVGGLQTDVGGLQTSVGGLQTSVGGLQTSVSNMQNTICIGLENDTTLTSNANYQTLDLSLGQEINKEGTKLSLSEGKVLIGSGVSKILVNANIQTQGDSTMYGLNIYKNSTSQVSNFVSPANASYNSISLSPFPIDVTDGDTIKVGVYINETGKTKTIKKSTTYLTVQVIK